MATTNKSKYVGRIAPTPSGHLHVGHAQTFFIALMRAIEAGGTLIHRVEDLDIQRCKPHYLPEMIEDLNWFGFTWDYGPTLESLPDKSSDPFIQTNRLDLYKATLLQLIRSGHVYPSPHSRKDIERALSGPHEGDREIIFPVSLRPKYMQDNNHSVVISEIFSNPENSLNLFDDPEIIHQIQQDLFHPRFNVNWRFRVPDSSLSPSTLSSSSSLPNPIIQFHDQRLGLQSYTPGIDFGDFLVWRSDGYPSYELAVVIDDGEMGITEVVRGEDLLLSTARQLLLYQALGFENRPNTNTPSTNSSSSSSASILTSPPSLLSPLSPPFSLPSTSISATTPSPTLLPLSLPPSSSSSSSSSSSPNIKFIPSFYHCPLLTDIKTGKRLAKSYNSLSLRTMREEMKLTPLEIMMTYFHPEMREEIKQFIFRLFILKKRKGRGRRRDRNDDDEEEDDEDEDDNDDNHEMEKEGGGRIFLASSLSSSSPTTSSSSSLSLCEKKLIELFSNLISKEKIEREQLKEEEELEKEEEEKEKEDVELVDEAEEVIN